MIKLNTLKFIHYQSLENKGLNYREMYPVATDRHQKNWLYKKPISSTIRNKPKLEY